MISILIVVFCLIATIFYIKRKKKSQRSQKYMIREKPIFTDGKVYKIQVKMSKSTPKRSQSQLLEKFDDLQKFLTRIGQVRNNELLNTRLTDDCIYCGLTMIDGEFVRIVPGC